jgi:flavin reductase (DIM6/NTAB) family NADH-FMN oxidoreductase RutF
VGAEGSEDQAGDVRSTEHLTISPSIFYVGTPVALLSTFNPDGSVNLAPMSSVWALGNSLVLGMSQGSQTAVNLARGGGLGVSYPGPDLWAHVERLAGLTGRDPVPEYKRARFRYVADKFAAAGLTPEDREEARPATVLECPLQLDADVLSAREDVHGHFLVVQADIIACRAAPGIVVPGTDHIDPSRWSPLIYNFRHYHGLDTEVGASFRAEVLQQ